MELEEKLTKHLLKKANVVSVGIGYRYKNGVKTPQISIVCNVTRKVSPELLKRKDLIPEKLYGQISTDVQEVGELKAEIDPGASISHRRTTAGTLGCKVYDNDGVSYILSNNHVMVTNCVKKGDSIIHPGKADGGGNEIAKLSKWIKFKKTNYVDAAIAKITDTIIQRIIPNIGVPEGTTEPSLGMKVHKQGRTTGYTTGVVEQINVTAKINMGNKKRLFKGQFATSDMSEPGDSGSLVLDGTTAVGLLFAGSDKITLCNPIDNVLNSLDVNIL